MSTTCPTCAAPDETVVVRTAVLDSDRPLDPPTRELLTLPPEPRRASGCAIALFVLAAFFGLVGVTALQGGGETDVTDTAYRFGRQYGALVTAAALLGIGLCVHVVQRNRRRAGADAWPQTYEQWQRLHQVWRAALLCRRCRVVFLPAAALRPDAPASPAVPVAHFPHWAEGVARQGEGAGTPGAPSTPG
ncbi:hypothetical protein [Kitasatospora sp. NPDC018619]|uniref:hypothetical protein n=1 Tax=unclassified Kitasatospora TaxID=2633591 RepID=UPI0037BC5166